MIIASNRVPGQLMPVGARYWYNAGSPKPFEGIGKLVGVGDLSEENILATSIIAAAIVRGLVGYYIGAKVAPKSKRKAAGVVGAISSVIGGFGGLALTTYIYSEET